MGAYGLFAHTGCGVFEHAIQKGVTPFAMKTKLLGAVCDCTEVLEEGVAFLTGSFEGTGLRRQPDNETNATHFLFGGDLFFST